MKISFFKYQGTGNDFVILDNRDNTCPSLSKEQIHQICDRRFGVGADGLMLLGLREGFDFDMKYYNADGREGSMCGNGGRCMVRFAHHMGIHKSSYHFMAADGPHEAEIDLNGWVRLRMKDVSRVMQKNDHYILDTGSPHYVKFAEDVRRRNVFQEGRDIRYSRDFEKEGINVNFVENVNDHTIFVRTYERGVEDETLSCGTGVTASALVAYHNEVGFNQVDVHTRGGRLSVEFDRQGDQHYTQVWLCGPADYVFRGEIELA